MQGRFQRGKVGGVSPFFAFQDIITSAMAVLITVVMLLALDMGAPGKASPEDVAPESLQQQWRGIMDALNEATGRLRAAQDAVAAAKLDPALLQGQINSLRAELDALHAQNQAGEPNSPRMGATTAPLSCGANSKSKKPPSNPRGRISQNSPKKTAAAAMR